VFVYLKTLEISGFKSFPDKTKIDFGRGITSIVGPNGSGKSNISDAIRWVLGEQSTKTLRGGKMEDVIFAGTRLRKGSNYAEVALTIDNSAHFLKIDYDEVVIARRYYRSGESDYFINKKVVRLKDINELLMDTGLGRDGYSMIGQGRIDEVLTKKSTERRDMFEEAAGISKFKYRKEETERKLNATEENLVRIRDILTEVEARYIPLEKKAEKARKYLVLRDELRGIEISLWVDNLRDMKEKTEKLHRDLNLAAFALEEARIASEKAYAASEETVEKMRLLELEEEEKRGELRLMEGELATHKSELSALETSIRLNDENAARMEGEIDAGQNRTGEIDASIRENLNKIEEIEAEKAELLTRIKTLRETLEALSRLTDEKGAKAAALQATIVDARMEKTTGETELAQLQRESESVTERAGQLAAERAQVEKAYTEQKARTEESQRKIQTARNELQSLENMQKGYRLRYDSRKARVDEVKLKLERALEEKNRATSRRNLLLDMQRDYEGFTQAVRACMREKRRGSLGGIHGTVAELSKTERDYTVAIETALGGALQNIVTDDEESAKRGIRFLTNSRSGRATFLPLTSVKPYSLNERGLETEAGFVGVAAELLDYDPKYRNVFFNLLGRTVVCRDLDSAVALARRRDYRFRIVTLDGQLVNQGGSMTGGSQHNAGGILSRSNEIGELAQVIEKANGEIEALNETHKKVSQELDSVTYQLEVNETEIARNKEVLLQEEARVASEEKLLETIETQLNRASEEAETLMEQKKRNKEQQIIVKTRIDESGKKLSEGEKKLAELLNENDGETGEADRISGEIATLSERVAACEAAVSERKSAMEDLRRILAGAREAMEDQRATLDTYRQSAEKGRSEKVLVEEKIAEKEADIASRNEKLREIAALRLEAEGKRNRFDKQAREKGEEIIRLEKETARLEAQKTALLDDEDRIVKGLWDQYELTVLEAEAICGEERLSEKSKFTSRAQELRGKMRALGEIDVGAIEEFEEVSARYNELVTQKTDIEKSKEELETMITEITGEMSKVFTEQFKLLNTYFNESFVEIFGGGSAELHLDDPSQILTCGIEIIVKLPGKNLRTISLLSGGEKAFVAIALYFAILKTRPAPFCVLDEIEAALDDANVVRFARYMRKMCEKTQFIVITHRRGTMEESDILYGVTMQEQGVSKLLIMNMESIGDWAEEGEA